MHILETESIHPVLIEIGKVYVKLDMPAGTVQGAMHIGPESFADAKTTVPEACIGRRRETWVFDQQSQYMKAGQRQAQSTLGASKHRSLRGISAPCLI